VRLGEEGRKLAPSIVRRDAQRVLERGVGEQHGAVAADHGHERGEQVEGLEAVRAV
jgi:hypothetical protein